MHVPAVSLTFLTEDFLRVLGSRCGPVRLEGRLTALAVPERIIVRCICLSGICSRNLIRVRD